MICLCARPKVNGLRLRVIVTDLESKLPRVDVHHEESGMQERFLHSNQIMYSTTMCNKEENTNFYFQRTGEIRRFSSVLFIQSFTPLHCRSLKQQFRYASIDVGGLFSGKK